MKSRTVWFLCLSLTTSPSFAQMVRFSSARPMIAVASQIRGRVAPSPTAKEVDRLRLGQIVYATGRTSKIELIAGKKGYWYRVGTPKGSGVWVFGGLLKAYDKRDRSKIVTELVDLRLKPEKVDFEEASEAYQLAGTALNEATSDQKRSEWEARRLMVLDKMAGNIGFGKQTQPRFAGFYNRYKSQLIYNEFAGCWTVKADEFWALERRHRGKPYADDLAWIAAIHPIPSETEGDEVAEFQLLSDTYGRYLGLYPKGRRAPEVIRMLKEALQAESLEGFAAKKNDDETIEEYRRDFIKALKAMREAVAKGDSREKDALLVRLDGLLAVSSSS